MSVAELLTALDSVPLLPCEVSDHLAVLRRLLPQVQQASLDTDGRLAKALHELDRTSIQNADAARVNKGLSRYKFWNSVVSQNPVPAVRSEAKRRLAEIADELIVAVEVALKRNTAGEAPEDIAPDQDVPVTTCAPIFTAPKAPLSAAALLQHNPHPSPSSALHTHEQPQTPDASATHPTAASASSAASSPTPAITAARQAPASMPPTWLTSSTPEPTPSPPHTYAPLKTTPPFSPPSGHHPDPQTPDSLSSHNSVGMWIPNALLELPECQRLSSAAAAPLHAIATPFPSTGPPSLHTPALSETPPSPVSSTTHTTHTPHPDRPATPSPLSHPTAAAAAAAPASHLACNPPASPPDAHPPPLTPTTSCPSSLFQFNDAFEAENSDEELDSISCNYSYSSSSIVPLSHHLPPWASAPLPSSPAHDPLPQSPLGTHHARSKSDLLYFQSNAAPSTHTAIDTHSICLALLTREPSVTLAGPRDSLTPDAAPPIPTPPPPAALPPAASLPPTAHPISPSSAPTPNPAPLPPALSTTGSFHPLSTTHTTSACPSLSPRRSPRVPTSLNPRLLPFSSPSLTPTPTHTNASHSSATCRSPPATRSNTSTNPRLPASPQPPNPLHSAATDLFTSVQSLSTAYYSVHSTVTSTHLSHPTTATDHTFLSALTTPPLTSSQLHALAAASSSSSAPSTPPAPHTPTPTTPSCSSTLTPAPRHPTTASLSPANKPLLSTPSTSSSTSDWRIESHHTVRTPSPAPTTCTTPTPPHPAIATPCAPTAPRPLPRDDSAHARAPSPALPPPRSRLAAATTRPPKPRTARADSAKSLQSDLPRTDSAKAATGQGACSRASSSSSTVVVVGEQGRARKAPQRQSKWRPWSLLSCLCMRPAREADPQPSVAQAPQAVVTVPRPAPASRSTTEAVHSQTVTTPRRRLYDSTHSTPIDGPSVHTPTAAAPTAPPPPASAPAPAPTPAPRLRAALPEPAATPPCNSSLLSGDWKEDGDELVLEFSRPPCSAAPSPSSTRDPSPLSNITRGTSPSPTSTRDSSPCPNLAHGTSPATAATLGTSPGITQAAAQLSTYASIRAAAGAAVDAGQAATCGEGLEAAVPAPRRPSLTQYAARMPGKAAGEGHGLEAPAA